METPDGTRGPMARAGEGSPPDTRPVNLRVERRRRGRSLRQMAAEIGVGVNVLRSAEHGSVPLPENQLRIAEFYGFDLLEQWPEPDAEAVV